MKLNEWWIHNSADYNEGQRSILLGFMNDKTEGREIVGYIYCNLFFLITDFALLYIITHFYKSCTVLTFVYTHGHQCTLHSTHITPTTQTEVFCLSPLTLWPAPWPQDQTLTSSGLLNIYIPEKCTLIHQNSCLLLGFRGQRKGVGGWEGVSPNSPLNRTTRRCDGLQQHVRLKPVDWVHFYRLSAGSR